MTKRRLLLIILLTAFSAQLLYSQHDTTTHQTIKVLSWNIYMLPMVYARERNIRAELIGRELAQSDYDILVFQEAFTHAARKRLRLALKQTFPYEAGPANRRLISLKTNSGLWILSRHPIRELGSIRFGRSAGIEKMARKGAQLVEVQIHGTPIHLLNTHLQSFGSTRLRLLQCEEFFKKLIQPATRREVPQLMCGDFNIDWHTERGVIDGLARRFESKYVDSLAGVYTYDRAMNDLGVEPGNRRDLLDYVFLRDNGAGSLLVKQQVVRRRLPWHPKYTDLSDHFAVEVTVQIPARDRTILAEVPAPARVGRRP